jgi:hypothetical protein
MLLLLMVGFLAVQGSPKALVVESQIGSILSLLGLSGLAVLTAWIEREARSQAGEQLTGEGSSSTGS